MGSASSIYSNFSQFVRDELSESEKSDEINYTTCVCCKNFIRKSESSRCAILISAIGSLNQDDKAIFCCKNPKCQENFSIVQNNFALSNPY